jgi:hypothetical protein
MRLARGPIRSAWRKSRRAPERRVAASASALVLGASCAPARDIAGATTDRRRATSGIIGRTPLYTPARPCSSSAMAQQREKRKKKRKQKKGKGGGGGGAHARQGGGVMQSMVRGFRRATGAEQAPAKKGSWVSNLIWFLVLAAAVAFVVSRYSQ